MRVQSRPQLELSDSSPTAETARAPRTASNIQAGALDQHDRASLVDVSPTPSKHMKSWSMPFLPPQRFYVLFSNACVQRKHQVPTWRIARQASKLDILDCPVLTLFHAVALQVDRRLTYESASRVRLAIVRATSRKSVGTQADTWNKVRHSTRCNNCERKERGAMQALIGRKPNKDHFNSTARGLSESQRSSARRDKLQEVHGSQAACHRTRNVAMRTRTANWSTQDERSSA